MSRLLLDTYIVVVTFVIVGLIAYTWRLEDKISDLQDETLMLWDNHMTILNGVMTYEIYPGTPQEEKDRIRALMGNGGE